MKLEADDARRAIEEWERIIESNRPENVIYEPFLSQRTVEFLGVNIIHRLHGFGNQVEGDAEALKQIWERFEQNNDRYGVYRAGKVGFSFREIELLGRIFSDAIDAELGTTVSRVFTPYIRNATGAVLELNSAFAIAGGMNNADLKASFEGFRQQVGLEI